ncbi:MAG: FecR domain-containing protein [Leptolyngbyaceae cyanobacterium]
MSPYFTMRKVSPRWCSLLLGASFVFSIPSIAWAQNSLTWAKVERLRNRVHLIPSGYSPRLARVADVMNIGDALRTSSSARAELRFNDGSLARVGEQATFRFTPNTRNFQLSDGTVLLLIPPGRGRTTIQTPNAVTGIQGSALFVRVRCLAELTAEGDCSSPITFVGALTNNPAGAMIAYNQSGSQQQPIHAGEMVVLEGDNITQRLEFDLATFYQTSGLVEGLNLDSPTPPVELSEDLQGVWQEIKDALELQGDFDDDRPAEEIVENPGFIVAGNSAAEIESFEISVDSVLFSSFPSFESSPAESFHNLSQVTVASSQQNSSVTNATPSESLAGSNAVDTNATIREVQPGLTSSDAVPVAAVSAPAPSMQPGTATPATLAPAPVVEQSTPSVVTGPVEQPQSPVVEISVPAEAPVAPPAVAVPSVETPQTPVVVAPTPTPVELPPAPVVMPEVPTVVETPAVVPTTPEVIAPTLEADQVPGREAVVPEEFDWQPSGANDPEVLQTPALEIEGSNFPQPTAAGAN